MFKAEDAATSLELLIRDYDSRGRRLRACQSVLLQTREQHPNLAFVLDNALAACAEEDVSPSGHHDMSGSLWAIGPLLSALPLFATAYVGATFWLGRLIAPSKPFDVFEPLEHAEFGPTGTPRALAGWLAALSVYLLLGPLIVCAAISIERRGCALRLGPPRHDPQDVARGIAALHVLLTLLLKPPFPENVAWWLTLLPCMLVMPLLAQLLLLVPRTMRPRSAHPLYPRLRGGGKGAGAAAAGYSSPTPRSRSRRHGPGDFQL